MPRTPKGSNFDLDLEFGGKLEDQLCRIFEGEGSVEVKADRLWSVKGNLVFEYMRQDPNSPDGYVRTGLLTTKANWWCNVLVKEEIVSGPTEKRRTKWRTKGMRIWPVEQLMYMLKHLLAQGRAWVVGGGDGKRTRMICVPLNCLCETNLFDYEVDQEIAKRRRQFMDNDFSAKDAIEIYEILKYEFLD
tara:strand:+ start:2765 stop:3331 length:567 start_codon:yes stop_codon:yes gene_type:complete